MNMNSNVCLESFGKKTYNVLVDNLFIFGMLLVLIGHSDVVDYYRILWLYKWVNLFHMPLFFGISGYLFALTGNSGMKSGFFFKKKIFRLLIPLVIVTTIGFLLKASMGTVAERPVEMNFMSYIHCFLYPGDNPVLFLWFLTVLFEIQIFIFTFYKIFAGDGARYVKWLIPICFIAFYFMPTIKLLHLSQVIYYIIFFVCGILFYKYETKIIRRLRLDSIGMMISFGILSIGSPYVTLSNYLAPVYAFIGMFFSISLMLNLQKINIRVFPKLRKYTYTIYLLSWFPQSFFRTILMPHVDFFWWPLISALSFIFALLIPYGIGLLVTRYFKSGGIAQYLRISIGLS